MRELTIDRFEGNFVICEDREKNMFAIDKAEMVKGAKEGDIIVINDDGEISVDKEKTQLRRKRIQAKEKNLWE